MNRRRFLLGLFGAGVGSSLLLGSGAASALRSNRTVSIAVAGDGDAYLRLAPTNRQLATVDSNGQLVLDVPLARDRQAVFHPLFEVGNHGRRPRCVWVAEKVGSEPERVQFFSRHGAGDRSLEGDTNAVTLDVGETLPIGVRVDTTDVEVLGRVLERVRIHAGVDCPDGTPDS